MHINFGSRAVRLAALLSLGTAILTPVSALCAPSVSNPFATLTTNSAPTISGTPPATVAVGQTYSFQPTANDADGNILVFSITDKPVWASLNKATGRLTGTPTLAQVGVYAAIEISVFDGTLRTKMPKFTITVTSGSTGGNLAPVISGTPVPTVAAGQGYSFQPTATDANGDTLVFSITGRPAWALLNKATGRLTGTPTAAQVGLYDNIDISVTDGTTNVRLPKFAITVTAGLPVVHNATLSWQAPTTNTDGTTLTNLSGYRIVYGTQAGQYTNSVAVSNVGITRYVVENLASGRYYFAVIALNGAGAQSDPSGEVSIDLT
jgi:hypothetical protein